MIIKDRAKVLKARVEDQRAALLADFEEHVAKIYKFDDDEVWKAATERAEKIVKEAQEEIDKQSKKLGIPANLAPCLMLSWSGRGHNASATRRGELRRVAEAKADAMAKAAVTNIERQSLDLRTQVVAMGLLSDDAKMFLDSLAPIQESMRALDFGEIERALIQQKQSRDSELRRYLE